MHVCPWLANLSSFKHIPTALIAMESTIFHAIVAKVHPIDVMRTKRTRKKKKSYLFGLLHPFGIHLGKVFVIPTFERGIPFLFISAFGRQNFPKFIFIQLYRLYYTRCHLLNHPLLVKSFRSKCPFYPQIFEVTRTTLQRVKFHHPNRVTNWITRSYMSLSFTKKHQHLSKRYLWKKKLLPKSNTKSIQVSLVAGFNPSEKYESNWKSFPNFRGDNKKYLSCHHLVS